MKPTVLALGTLALIVAALPATADDLFPPDFRGANRSTSAEWDFFTDQSPAPVLPDGTSVPLVTGDAAPLLDAAFPTGAPHPSGQTFGDVSFNTFSNGTYVGGPLGDGAIAFNVPNWIDNEPSKILRIQVTYTGNQPTTAVFPSLGVPGSGGGITAIRVDRVDIPSSPDLPAGTSYFYEDWQITPNPDWEQVVLFLANQSFVDQVVIDTVSGPTFHDNVVFLNGFETGDTSQWSSESP